MRNKTLARHEHAHVDAQEDRFCRADRLYLGFSGSETLSALLAHRLRERANPINAIWESLVSVFMEVFENQPKDQFAMRIPIEGDINDPDQDLWSGFFSIFSNAFGGAFTKDIDGNVSFNDALLDN